MTAKHWIVCYETDNEDNFIDSQSFDTLAAAKKCYDETLPHDAIAVTIELCSTRFSSNDRLREHPLDVDWKVIYRREATPEEAAR